RDVDRALVLVRRAVADFPEIVQAPALHTARRRQRARLLPRCSDVHPSGAQPRDGGRMKPGLSGGVAELTLIVATPALHRAAGRQRARMLGAERDLRDAG